MKPAPRPVTTFEIRRPGLGRNWVVVARAELRRLDELEDLEARLREIADIMEAVDNRLLAADGPVGRFQDEVWDNELKRIYALASGKRLKKRRRR